MQVQAYGRVWNVVWNVAVAHAEFPLALVLLELGVIMSTEVLKSCHLL